MRRIRLFGAEIDAVTMPEAVAHLRQCAGQPERACRYVVTPNVDHLVTFQRHEGLRAAYRDAEMILADGAPVVWASRLLRRPVPERVAGSDLVPALLAAATNEQPLSLFLLGAAEGVADRAAVNIRQKWSAVNVVGTYSPPLGFEKDDAENERILAMIVDASPDVLIVGFGAPKQELWVHRHREQINAGVALCAGATIDFLAGHRSRAPIWMRRTGLEWLHRLASEPRRLCGRYAHDAWVFPQLVWKELRGHELAG